MNSYHQKVLNPESDEGEQRRSAFACAPITVWSAFNGNVEQREGGRRKDEERRGVGEPSLISVTRLCIVCDRVSTPVLLPFCCAWRFGGQVVHDSGDPWNLLDLIHHLQHHLRERKKPQNQ